jgi:hypothetical protein
MATRRIGLSLGGDAIPLSTFLDAASSLGALLSELDVAISGSHNLDWVIADLSLGSANLAVTPVPISEEAIDRSPVIISSALNGMEVVEKAAEWPEHFTEEALLRAKKLVGLINGRVERIAIFGNPGERGTKRVRVTQRVAANVDQLIGTSTVARGSIEGTLETLTIHGGTAFNVYDMITLRKVRCICDRKTLDELASALGKRLLVEGDVRYNVYGQPISIRVEQHGILRTADQLPQAKDIRGLFSKQKINTAELSEYLRN